ncbi:MAG: class I SAM-dependent methyltransferase [Phycisphaerales bacterium]|nr:class I SAM-dependent methyltransferase [Phycisphaerales bacterium]
MPTTANPVREHYEQLPYPPAITNLDAFRDGRQTCDGCPAHFFHLYWPHRPYRDDLDILVAGCGTSQAAKIATLMPRARVLGIDLSRTALDATRRLKDAYGLERLELAPLAIEDVATLDRQFDFILSTGALHHTPDPAESLAALRSVLRDDGAMHLMVYATHGRAGVTMLQAYCRQVAVTTEPDELAALGVALERLAPDHPIRVFAHRTPDLADAIGRADALLTPIEHTFTADGVHDWLAAAGLRFDRWFLQAPYLPSCGFVARTPHATRLATLPPAAQAAAVELLRGTLITHTVATRPAAATPPTLVLDPADDRFGHQVPLMFPGVAIDRGPDGVVVGHGNHREADLALPLTNAEAAVLDAIDGSRSVDDLVASAGARDAGRRLFVRLWEHDAILLRTPDAA